MSEGRQRLGRKGEALARRLLEGKGYRIEATNYRCPQGEVDIVARDGDCLVFVEVRTRRSREYGTPEESVTAEKRRRMVEVAQAYLQSREGLPEQWRIDVVAVEVEEGGRRTRLRHHENAVTES